MKCIKAKAGKSPVLAHLNINSYTFKYIDIASIFSIKLVDIFAISETKIDMSFPDAQFSHPGYNIFRKDRNRYGGEIII